MRAETAGRPGAGPLSLPRFGASGEHAAPQEPFIKCPRCAETELVVSHRQGVEIDSCPRCRGVWLDRGELDKLIERSTAMEAAAASSTAAWLQPEQARSDVDADRRTNGSRKHSWLSHIFD